VVACSRAPRATRATYVGKSRGRKGRAAQPGARGCEPRDVGCLPVLETFSDPPPWRNVNRPKSRGGAGVAPPNPEPGAASPGMWDVFPSWKLSPTPPWRNADRPKSRGGAGVAPQREHTHTHECAYKKIERERQSTHTHMYSTQTHYVHTHSVFFACFNVSVYIHDSFLFLLTLSLPLDYYAHRHTCLCALRACMNVCECVCVCVCVRIYATANVCMYACIQGMCKLCMYLDTLSSVPHTRKG